MSKHTPGPWSLSETGPKYSINAKGTISTKHIAMVSCYVQYPNDGGENIANAKLIAAAPELDEALWEMRDAATRLFYIHNDSEPEDVDEAHEQYRKAEAMFHKVISKLKD